MDKKIKYVVALFVGCFALFFPLTTVVGESLNFSVKAILPEDQRDKDHSYFDLRVNPGEKRVIQVELTNDTDEELVVAASANAAITNDNGVVDYSHSKTEKDSTAKTIFSEIASMPKEITLPKKSKKTVDVTITMPNEVYNGYILGGLYFEQKNTDKPNKDSNEAVLIENRYSYVVGVLLSETDESVPPELKLNEVKATQLNLNNAVIMNIQNTTAAMIPNLTLDAKLYYENETKPRYEHHQEGIKMAPNTNFNYRIELKEQPFVAGNYKVKVVASDGNREWEWEKAFEIEAKEAKKYNETAINLPPEPKNNVSWILILIAGILFLLLLTVLFFHIRQKKQEKPKE